MRSFYSTMYRCMVARGLRFIDLAERTGFNPAYFAKLKNGQMHDVTWSRALAIIAALGMTPDEFYAEQLGDE